MIHVLSSPRHALVRAALLLGAILAPAAFADASASPPSFDDAWKELQAVKSARAPEGASAQQVMSGLTERARRTNRLAWDIFEGYPKDPRRWLAAAEVIRATHGYVYDVVGDPQKDGPKAYVRDEAARAAWGAYAKALYDQSLTAPGVPEDALKAICDAYIYRLNMTPGSSLAEQRAVIDEFARRFPQDEKLVSYEQRYYLVLQDRAPGEAVDHLQRMLQSENAAVRKMAEGKALLATGRTLDLKFTAVDGREVDAGKLRGKVVLVDFWATWCGPCVAELPNVKRVYDQYHDKGFEVIAVSLDADKQKLLDFVKQHDLPWPQHFDGKAWKNELARKFSVSAIPAMLLVDRDGKIVSNNARGHKLEADVKHLLGL